MPKRIKICYIIPEYNFDTDSHLYHLYEFIEELSKKLDIFLIVEKSSGRKINFGKFKKVYVQKFKFTPFRFLESFFTILKARILGYKVFYTHICYIGGVNAAIISRFIGGRSYYWNCAMNWLFKQRKYSGIGYRLCLKFSHFLVTGSEVMKQGYVEYYHLNPERVKVMPNWINLNRFQPKPKTQDSMPTSRQVKLKTLLFVHWLSKRKGVDTIVPIIKHLLSDYQSSGPDFKLLVVGEGPYKQNLIDEINENKLGKYIKLVGGISNKNIVDYYTKADIFIMPSMEEGFPRVLLETMAIGIPYVASDVGAVREISPETAQRFLVKAGDVEMFAHKIENLLSDQEIYNQFKKEELDFVNNYSLEKIMEKFIKIIS